MKHDMNKISGYYQGEDGIFYDFWRDEIFELEWTGAHAFRLSLGKTVGKYYVRRETISRRVHPMAICGMQNVIRLGPL